MSETLCFAGRMALVTGAGSPLGRSIALALAQLGARVLLHGNKGADSLRDFVSQESVLAGSRVIQSDLRINDSMYHLAREAVAFQCDLLVCNAAVYERTPLEKLTAATMHKMLEVNLTAPVVLATEIGLALKQTNMFGDFVFISDAHTVRPYRGCLPYLVSKAALESAMQCLALELAPNVRVNAVAPGLMSVPNPLPPGFSEERWCANIPLGHIGSPQDVAAAVVSLVQQTYITGSVLRVDGGRVLR